MAEENKTNNTVFEDMMLTLFAFLLVGQMLQRGPEMLSERFGIGGETSNYLVASAALSVDTPIGTQVNTPNGTAFFASPGGEGEPLGTFPPGSALILSDGPQTIGKERWWKVESPITGDSGWVKESSLVQEGVGGLGPATKLGTKARALLDATVWESPGSYIKTGFLSMGDWGELTKGPKEKNGSRWWFFDKDGSDDDGWITEAALLLASDSGWKEGSRVRGEHTVDIFERAGSGQVVGMLKKGEGAKILGGPVEVGGKFWWLIETEEGEIGWVAEADLEDAGVKSWFKSLFIILMIVGTIVTLILLAGIVYVTIRTNQVRAKESQKIKSAIPEKIEPRHNERWEKILAHVSSENPNDWRLAIIEADIMLDEVITKMGYVGDTLGEKLKMIARGDMESLDSAWEAHKVRNQIAHVGNDFILTQREAKRVIDLYTAVFRELKSI